MTDVPYALTIDGQRVFSNLTQPAINPATEDAICDFPLATREHLDAAVAAARKAFPAWRDRPLAERQALVNRLADLISDNREAFIQLLIAEQGKSRLGGAEWEVDGAANWIREIAKQSLSDEVVKEDGENLILMRHVPIGVIGCITPWNVPLMQVAWKVAPALVTGNTVVLKPSPYTPLCSLWFGELAQSILPPGVVNIVSGGNDLGQWMTEHPGIGKISFTGSSATGARVMASAAVNIKRLTLELGGNDPAIVMPDVDPRSAAQQLFWAAFINTAQGCVCTKRLYVHEQIYDDFARELVDYASQIKVGSGMDTDTMIGPLQNKMQFDKVRDLLEDCRSNGMRFLMGGEVTTNRGYFIPITIVDNPPEDSRCVVEEAFGPVLPLLKFRDVDDVIRRANDTSYGLAATIWSNDLDEANRIGRQMETGTVWINQCHTFAPDIPFAGHKISGLGVENSLHGLAELTNMQTVACKAFASA